MSLQGKFDGKTFSILGFGRSGRAAADYLLPRGGRLTVFDEKPLPPEVKESFRARGVRFCEGAFPPEFPGEVLVRSPGIRPDIPPILAALARGAELGSETGLFLDACPATVIGVTGSDGKTTTAALIAALLGAGGKRVFCGGNNGTPLLPHVEEMTKTDFAVLELSSFQLMTPERAPAVAVITNLSPNHLNWHRNMAEYIAAKCRIFRGAGRLVTNADCALTRNIAEEAERAGVPVTLFSLSSHFSDREKERVYPEGDHVVVAGENELSSFDCRCFRLPGRHNLENLCAALGAAAPYLSRRTVPAALSAFRGVPHRLQYAGTVNGVEYYNSSIDTSPSRTAAALSALSCRPLVIAGGRGKGIPLTPLADALAEHAKAVFLYGETAGEIAEELNGRVPATVFGAFREAFSAASAAAVPGDTVLLSPGCTAFDQFRDFEERGEVFLQMVAALPRKG